MVHIPTVTGRFILVFVTLKYVTHVIAEDLMNETQQAVNGQEPGDIPPEEYPALVDEHQGILNQLDDRISHVKSKVGKLYSQNSAILHRLNKLDEFIKRGADMETRYVIEILGYPFDQKDVPPEEFLERLAVVFGISNFKQSHVRGLRLLAGTKYSNARLAVEFFGAKAKKTWLRAYKKKLYAISWGDPDKVFGTKETFKTFQHKTVYLQDLLPTLCEMYGLNAIPFSIQDYISPYRKKLLSYAKMLAAHYQYRFVWVSEGDIFVRKKDGDRGIYIRSEKDFRIFDWRLENEKFFWKTLNECNIKRREILMKSTRRMLPWMKTVSQVFTKPERLNGSMRYYRRRHHKVMKFLLNSTQKLVIPDVFDVTYKYKPHTLFSLMNQSRYLVSRNIDL